MSRLGELIRTLCPDGVEYKNLEDCCVILDNMRQPVKKSRREGGAFPYYGANGVQDYVSEYIFDGTYVLVGEDGSVITKEGTPVVNWAVGKMWVNNHAHIISEKEGVSLRFLFHYLQTINISHLVRGNIPKLTGGNLRALQIPVPPMEVQEEIVRILDKFTQLEAELEAELEARKKQYEHYRDTLLDFTPPDDENVTFRTIGDIGKVCMCKRIMKNETSKTGDVPFYKIGTFGKEPDAYISYDLYKRYKERFSYPKKGDVLISAAGTIGRTVIYDGKPAYFQDSNIVWVDNDETLITNKFLFYIYQKIEWQIEGSTIKRLYNDNLMRIKIPIPPIEEQERIVGILDKFEALCTDLCEGLPAEIEARRRQYEHYRDKLLSFKRI